MRGRRFGSFMRWSLHYKRQKDKKTKRQKGLPSFDSNWEAEDFALSWGGRLLIRQNLSNLFKEENCHHHELVHDKTFWSDKAWVLGGGENWAETIGIWSWRYSGELQRILKYLIFGRATENIKISKYSGGHQIIWKYQNIVYSNNIFQYLGKNITRYHFF